jgi:hypothetical protein
MWFRSWLEALITRSSRYAARRVKRVRGCRNEARRLFLEGLEDRNLMAFNVMATYTTGANPFALALTAIDPGNRPDLVTANVDNTVSVRLGNADGTFGALKSSATGAPILHGVAAGDLTGDGISDLVTATFADPSLLVGHGDGTFEPPLGIPLPTVVPPDHTGPESQKSLSVAVGDLNHDGKLDLAVTARSTSYYGYYTEGYVNVLVGNGAGKFSLQGTYDLGLRVPSAVTIADINGDGDADVMTTNAGDLSVLLGDNTGSLGAPLNSGAGFGFRSISLGDVDGDGKLDTVMNVGPGGVGLSVQKGSGTGLFAAQPAVFYSTGVIASAVLGDVNADGKLDVVAVDSDNQFIGGSYLVQRQADVLIGNGLGGFAAPLVSSLGSEPGRGGLSDLVVADLNGDNLPDLATIDSGHSKAIVAINDGNWNPQPAISIADATMVEGDSGSANLVFTVGIVGSHGNVSVNYATASSTATAGTDFTSKQGTLTFGPSEFTKTISIPILGDTLDEDDEQFFVNLTSPIGGVITDSQAVGTIQDNDPPPLLSISDVSKNEGNGGTTSFVFTVMLSVVSGRDVYVNYATADGTATVADSDYIAKSGMLYIAPGQKTAAITVTVLGDKKQESNETFLVKLTGATNGTISDSQGVGTIVNDDGSGGGGGKGKPNSANFDLALLDDTWTTTGKRK